MLRSYRNGKISIYFSTKLNYRSTTTATMATATMATNECPRLQVAEPTTRRPLVSSVFRPTSEQVVVHTLSQWNPSYFKGTHTHTHTRARAHIHTHRPAVLVVPEIGVRALITLRYAHTIVGQTSTNAITNAFLPRYSPNQCALAHVCMLVHYASIHITRQVLDLREF